MADRIITAEAIITAKDATGDVFTKIAGKFQQLGKGAKVSADIERMSKTIEQANSQLRALEKLQSTRTGFADARSKFQAQKTAVEQAARAMKEAEKPTRALEAAYQRTQNEVVKASAAFERSKAAMMDAKHAAEGFGTPLARISEQQARLRGVIDGTTKSIEHQAKAEIRAAEAHAKAEKAAERRAEGMRHHGIVNYALGSAAAYVGAHSVVTGIEKTMHAGAEYQHELVGLRNAGRTPEQIAAIQSRSSQVVEQLPTATYLDNMKVVGETTQAFGSVEHAMEHLEFMQKAMSVLKASGGEHIKGTSGDVGRAFAKTFEERLTRPEDFEKEASAMIPAMVASGGVFNPEQLYAFAQQAKSALPSYNMRFLSRIAPSLIGSMGGERAGTAAFAFDNVINGRARDKKQAAEWMRLGLLDPNEVIGGKGSPIGWKAGAVKETTLAGHDPLEWAEKVLIPAMQKHGVDTDNRDAVKQELATLFRNGMSNLWAMDLVQAASRNRLHKDELLTNQVGSTDDIYHRNLQSDPGVGLQAFNASLENLMTTVSGPAMGTIASGLSGVASGIDALANALKDHPMLAMTAGAATGVAALGGAGYAGMQLMNGFGLGTSATALDASAVALDGAAAALDAAALKMGVAGAAGGAASAVEGAAVGGGLAGEVKDGAKVAVGLGAAATGAAMVAGAAIAAGGVYVMSQHPNRARFRAYQNRALVDDIFGQPFAMPGSLDSMPPTASDGAVARGRSEAPTLDKSKLPGHWVTARGGIHQWVVDASPTPFRGVAPAFARGIYDETALPLGPIANAPSRVPSLVGAGPLSPASPFTGPVEATVKPDQITAKLEGQATVTVAVKVDGGQVTGQFASSSGNIRTSVGTSMPGAKVASNGRIVGPN